MKTLKTIAAGSVFAVSLAACGGTQAPPPETVKAPPPTVEVSPSDRMGSAAQAYKAGDFEKALTSYDAVLAKEPDNVPALYNRAVTLQRLGRSAEAKAGYEAVLSKAPEDSQAALNLGAIMKDEGNLDEAIALYERALKADEFNSDLLNNLSVLYRDKKRHRRAVDALRKLLKRDKDNIDAYKNLALVYYDQKQYRLAQTILENALRMTEEQKKKDPDIYVNLGMVFLAQTENGKAMAAFKKAVALDPSHVTANYNIGVLALGHRDYNLAAKSYEVVAKARPTDHEVMAALGYAYQGQQKLELAAKQLEAARELQMKSAAASANVSSSDEEQMLLQLVVIWQGANSADKALQYAEQYMRMKSMSCGDEDFDGFCGRYNGIKMMKQMAAQPPPAEEKPKATGVDVFTDQGPEGAEGAEGGEGAAAGDETGGSPGAEAAAQ